LINYTTTYTQFCLRRLPGSKNLLKFNKFTQQLKPAPDLKPAA
jgi:hypothetical protein